MKTPTLFTRDFMGFTLVKKPNDMSKSELLDELAVRLKLEKKYSREASERTLIIHELELHQLELEIQNRELIDSYKHIEESRNKYADLYDFSPAGYVTLDYKGKVIELNMTAARLLNKEKSFILGKCFSRWIPTDMKRSFMHHLQEVTNVPEDKLNFPIEIINEDNQTCTHVQLHTVASTDKFTMRPVYRIAMLDMTVYKKAEVLENRNRELFDEKGLRENFVTTLSHDLRTPLTSSKLCAQMLEGGIVDYAKKKKLFKMLVEELDRADRMIKELLDANRINGKENMPLLFKKCDLDKIAQKSIDCFTNLYAGKVSINYKVTGEVIGYWSKDAIQRVIDNLLHNALKYGAEDMPITLAVEDRVDKVCFTIHNYGNPISARDQKKIFEAFHRTQEATESTKTGWGLGLNLVNTLVKNHKGTIRVKSNLTEGTSFIVELPKKT